MKQLIIARHAKSSRDDILLADTKRGLSKRGKNDLKHMGDRLLSVSIQPDLILTSPALRTKKTALYYAGVLGIKKKKLLEKEKLYLADLVGLIKVIERIPEEVKSCMIVGHNPGLTELVNHCGHRLDNLPTCGIVCFEYTSTDRGNFKHTDCELWHYMAPKLLTDSEERR